MKKFIYTSVWLASLFFSHLCVASSTTTLQGKVMDATTEEPILFSTVALYKNDVLVTGTETDLDGNYFFADLDPGVYDIEASYVGYQTKRLTGVQVKADVVNITNLKLSEGTVLEEVVFVAYKTPLISMDNTISGATVTAEKIRSLPLKSTNELAARVAGITITDETVSIRGSRANETVYYVDGIRIAGSENLLSMPADNTTVVEPPTFDYNNESYGKIIENTPASPFVTPLSTFSIDVDRASYSNVRRMVEDGDMPDPDAVRIEELINYFNYNYEAPKDGHPFAVHSELAQCPWDAEKQILRIGLQGQQIALEDLPPSNIVFLIDVSGSMSSHNKLPLVKQSFELLLEQLREEDRVAIVTYAGRAGVALPSTSAANKEEIMEVLHTLESGGSTAGADGINTAYEIALDNFLEHGNNRVVLATDGDFNVGVSSNRALEDLIASKREQGIFLSVLGYGMGNYKDDKLQLLADKGNGNHAYIDDIQEAKKVLVEEFGGTMFTIAKDVKIQIEFNPAYVSSYRLVGYENRLLNPEDFADDKKDAGEIGSGHSVTALYEILPNSSTVTSTADDKLVYQKRQSDLDFNEELGQIQLRYKIPNGKKSKLITKKFSAVSLTEQQVSNETKHAMAVAEYGLVLRDSKYKGSADLLHVKSILESPEMSSRADFLALVEDTIEVVTVE